MKKIIITILCISMITPVNCLAMGSKPKISKAANAATNKANEIGNSDAWQEAGGRIGEAGANFGKNQVNNAWNHTNSAGQLNSRAQQAANTGTRIFAGSKALELGSKAAPHIGWIATAGGRAYEGDYSGAALEAANGGTRTVVVAHVGTAVGLYAGGKIGALAGSWGGPLGAFGGFVIGVSAAWVAGHVWDNGIGKGKDALDQKFHDWDAESKYGGKRNPVRAAVREGLKNTNRQTIRSTRPSGSGSSCPGGSRCRK